MKTNFMISGALVSFMSFGISFTASATDGPSADPLNQGQSQPGARSTDERALQFASGTPLDSSSNIIAILTAAGYKATSPVSYHAGGAIINGLYTCRQGSQLFGRISVGSLELSNQAPLNAGVSQIIQIPTEYTKSVCQDSASGSSEGYCTQTAMVVVKQPAVFEFIVKVEVPSSVQSGAQVSWFKKTISKKFIVPDCNDKIDAY